MAVGGLLMDLEIGGPANVFRTSSPFDGLPVRVFDNKFCTDDWLTLIYITQYNVTGMIT